MQGRVMWFNHSKGFGHIEADGVGEVFVHYRNIETVGRRELHTGQVVEFDTVPGVVGLQAVHVHPVLDAPVAA